MPPADTDKDAFRKEVTSTGKYLKFLFQQKQKTEKQDINEHIFLGIYSQFQNSIEIVLATCCFYIQNKASGSCSLQFNLLSMKRKNMYLIQKYTKKDGTDHSEIYSHKTDNYISNNTK